MEKPKIVKIECINLRWGFLLGEYCSKGAKLDVNSSGLPVPVDAVCPLGRRCPRACRYNIIIPSSFSVDVLP